MNIENPSPRVRLGRRMALALASGTLLLSGCVSAMDGTSAFGLQPTAGVEELAEGVAAEDVGAAQPVDLASAPEIGLSPESTEATEVADVAGSEPSDSTSAATTPSMVAFAAPDVPSRDPNRSLYASLFTEAEAKTPVRNAERGKGARVVVTHTDGVGKPAANADLPGVDPSSLFEIGQKASVDDEDFLDDIGGYQVASLSGMARLAPSGLLVQREDVDTRCFDTELVGLLRQIERRFGQKVVITSGYRSPAHNRRVRGAKASLHMACKAADLHVPGVEGRRVAEFVRSLPRRGGVGTYCHTAAIHVDTGPKRDWNWACRRRN